MRYYPIALFIAAAAILPVSAAIPGEAPSAREMRTAVERSLPAISKTVAEYPHKVQCFSCHHQGVGGFALSLAKRHGFTVDADLKATVTLTEADLRHDLKSYTDGDGQPGGVTRAGYALFMLHAAGEKPDDVTEAVTNWMLKRDVDLGFWKARSNRPPGEFSNFTDTFLAIEALTNYGNAAKRDAISARIARARAWLETATTKETEDRVFRLWALKAAGAGNDVVKSAADELVKAQLPDGGWAQLPGGASDPYATGSVLAALRETGMLSERDPVCMRGIGYLIKEQLPDGTWHVVTRSHPVQPYFESGFPYGKDQFVSMTATGWAIAAMCLSGA